MTTKTKTFDSVAMKRQCQQDLLQEYEAHKDEYSSFTTFIHKTAQTSKLAQQIREKIARGKKCNNIQA